LPFAARRSRRRDESGAAAAVFHQEERLDLDQMFFQSWTEILRTILVVDSARKVYGTAGSRKSCKG
jgi:hypothetical protein